MSPEYLPISKTVSFTVKPANPLGERLQGTYSKLSCLRWSAPTKNVEPRGHDDARLLTFVSTLRLGRMGSRLPKLPFKTVVLQLLVVVW
jgi:hypothetical protein